MDSARQEAGAVGTDRIDSVAVSRESRLELALVHLRAALDAQALRLPVELLLGALMTHRHGASFRADRFSLPLPHPRAVQTSGQLGHANPSVTLSTYAPLFAQATRQ
jgi:hypothetical protein